MQQKFLISKDVVICDYREEEISKILESFGLKVVKENLDFGDFVVSKDVCIERKSYDDFINSIIDKRIFIQCEEICKNFKKPVIIVEFSKIVGRELNRDLIFSSLSKLISKWNISIIFTRNIFETSKIIYWLKIIEDKENKDLSLFYVGKKPKEIYEIKKFVLSSFPGISEKNAEKLIKEFKSLEKIFNSDFLRISKVIGRKRARRFLEILKNEETSNSGN